MASALPAIATQLGADERTLRRATQRGTVRARRPGARSLELAAGELEYLRSHWDLLSSLTRALRTEPSVRTAVLYGSHARGDNRRDSDIDLLVDFRDDRAASAPALAQRLAEAVGAPVDVARLPRVRSQAPLLVLQALDEGRVLVDREDQWNKFLEARETVARAARRQMSRQRREAADSIQELMAEA